ncbi:hypothetical protein ACIBG0_15530 [Nocardia sp. NPDC050630]|uniref:hypothetical protein n=1 Tax=Nocardia sp. NPDC050630 TaxID=3364321 RepID=UPI0037B512B5
MSTFAGSVVTAIESTWATIRDRHPDVPDVVVAMAAGSIGSPRGVRLGHFGPDRWLHGQEWMPELFVGGEGFALSACDVLGTLLHEAAHGVARARGVQDTSRRGAYQNAKYRGIANEFGLTVVRQASRGWSETTVPDEIAEQYRQQIDTLHSVLVAYRRSERGGALAGPAGVAGDSDDETSDEDGEDDQRAPRNGRALTCGCDPVRRVRAAQRTIDAGPILCGICQQPFAIAAA